MTESDRIESAEAAVLKALSDAGEPVSSTELGQILAQEDGPPAQSLVRLAVQRMIGRGTVEYGTDRRYSLGVHQPQV